MTTPRVILFDLDGVLVKSEEAWFYAVSQSGVRFRRGRAVTREEFATTFGQGTEADIERFKLKCTVAQLDAFYEHELLLHLDSVWVDPDAKDVLETLKARGVRLGLVTNSVAKIANALVRFAGLGPVFEVVATADRVKHSKPAPDLVVLALAELNVTAKDAWFVGDSRFDREAAAAAGVRFVGLGLDGDDRIERLSDLTRP